MKSVPGQVPKGPGSG